MTKKRYHLLIIEDDKVDQMAFERFVKKNDFPFTFQLVDSIKKAKLVLKHNSFDAIVSDFFLGDGTAFEILDLKIDLPIIVVTGTGSEEIAVKALKKGAYDYLIKDVDGNYLKMLPITVQNALERYHAEKKLQQYHTNLEVLVEERTAELRKEIAARKKTEKRLKKNEAHLRTLIETIPDLVWMKDPDGVFLICNDRFEKFYGAPKSVIIGKTDYDFVDKKLADFFRKNDKIAIAAGKPCMNEEEVNFANDGHHEILEVVKTPVYDSESKLIGVLGIARDITARKQTEDEIIKLSTAVKQSPSVITITNLEGDFEYVNPKFTKLTGYQKEEVLGKNASILNSGEQPKEFYKAFWESIISAKEWRGEFRNKKKNGELFWEAASISPIYDKKGEMVNYIKVAEDITDQKKAKAALTESEEKFRKAFLTSPDSININRLKDGMYVSINSGFTKIMGYSEEDVLGKTSAELNVWKNARDRRRLIAGLKKRGIVENLEAQFYSKNKEIKEGLMSASIIELNGLPHILNITRDITARKRAEQIQKVLYNISNAVITSESLEEFIANIKIQLNNIIDTTNYYIALYDEQTDTFSLPFMTDEKDMMDSFPAEKTVTGYVIKSGKPLIARKQEQKRMAKNGEIKIVGSLSEIWLGVPLKTEGKVIGVLAVQSYTDENAFDESDMVMLEFVSEQISISIERKKVEQDLKLALEKATESDRLKSAFLATMSHELRTPLNAIIGFSDIINEEVSIKDIVSFNKNINSSGYHLLNIVEDLFDITLIETGQTRIKLTDVNVYSILNEVQEIILIEQLKTNKDHLEIKRKFYSETDELIIHTDSSKLKQVLINLLKNALKFTHEGFVSYGFDIEIINKKSMLKFYVKDTGIGIPKEKQELIFDVFRQVEDSNTRVYGGTGIGLSISKKISKLLGGDIWLESEEGKGSSFYFAIPLGENENSEKLMEFKDEGKVELKNNATVKLEKKLILIVEDVEDSAKLLKVLLESSGYNTLWAVNGKEAVKSCKENQGIDLVLMDVNMPLMNGYEATMEIKKFRPDLPIISQTAYATLGDEQKSLDAGCDDYISKPIKKDALIKIITDYL